MTIFTETLLPNATGYGRAVEILSQGGLVSFPTETVYGLGADARDDHAIARIFEAKGRPRFNPLIVHVSDATAAQHYVEWNDTAEMLAHAFWPGPLTLVLPLRADNGLSPLVTADLPTLAIRVPAHPVGQTMLTQFGGPVAAPSANPSGQISPTNATHVQNGLSGRIEAIIDGGACEVGLESTILGLSGTPRILRPGGLITEQIEACVGYALEHHQSDDPLSAPGQMQSHYAPGALVRLNATMAKPDELFLGFGQMECDINLSTASNLTEAAANLFRYLHDLDQRAAKAIAVAPIPETGLGCAINDRLRRAAAPRP